MARSIILTTIVVAAECPDPSFLFLLWWPQSAPIHHSHFYRGGRGVARSIILTFIVVAAECPDLAFSLLSWCDVEGISLVKVFFFRFKFSVGFQRPS